VGAVEDRRRSSTTRLRVCLDARLEEGVSGGVQQFVIGLARGLSQLGDADDEYLFLASPDSSGWLRPYLTGACRLLPVQEGGVSRAAVRGARRILPRWLRARGGRVLDRVLESLRPVRVPVSDGTIERAGVDVMHFTVQAGFLTEVPSIYQPYDLQHLHLPRHFPAAQRRWRETVYPALCRKASRVAVMSRWVKNDVVRQYHLAPEKVQIVSWAPVLEAYPVPGAADLDLARAKFRLPVAFAFYPAQTFRHKNHIGLLEALALLRDRRGLVVPAVFSGTLNEFFPAIRRRVRELRLDDQVRFLGYVSPLELQCLYRLCTLLAFPSRFEGGGMPIQEAFSTGVAVACSNVTCLPEQVGDAALLFDPGDVGAIASALERLWRDPELRGALAAKGRARVAPFTWSRTARVYRALYRLVGGRSLTDEDRAALAEPPAF
jgi:glycosyltransferase involved in cell wall biosynthesis